MITIHKFHAPVQDDLTISMPEGAEVLTVQLQYNQPTIWARVDNTKPLVPRVFHWRGTGHSNCDCGRYVGTIQELGGQLVFHLFVEG